MFLNSVQVGYTFDSETERSEFEAKFANLSYFLPDVRNIHSKYLKNEIGALPFCQTASALTLSQASKEYATTCNLFRTLLTANGNVKLD